MATPLHEKTFISDQSKKLPRPFILRRLHSLLGVWLSIYLFEHLLVNSQSAFYFQDEGNSFISMVNKIHSISFLKVVEILFLALPFLIHGIWGIIYLRTAKLNSFKTDGTKPSLPQYRRNRAFSWQRITSWILLVGILAHVVHMRFIEYPILTYHGEYKDYTIRIKEDAALQSVAAQLGVGLLNKNEFDEESLKVERKRSQLQGEVEQNRTYYQQLSEIEEEKEWIDAVAKKPLKEGEVYAIAPSAGAAFLLILRDTFKSPLMVILYSILVIAAAYHGFNGLWTCMITWGFTLSRRSQTRMRAMTTTLMAIVMFLGLMAAWGTYLNVVFQG